MSDDLGLSREFRVRMARAEATSVVAVGGGFAVLNRDYPASHVHNMLWLADPVPVAAIVPVADRVLDGHGHRLVEYYVSPPVDLDRLPGGWRVDRTVVMSHRGNVPAKGAAQVLPPAALRRAAIDNWSDELPVDVACQLADRIATAQAASLLTVHARLVDDAPVSWCQLRRLTIDGRRVAEIHDVNTRREHRGRGYSRDALASALETAAGSDLIFLLADADDWPLRWYERMGFAAVGQTWTASRG